MKIAVASKGTELSSLCDDRFGRCETLLFIIQKTKLSYVPDDCGKIYKHYL